MGILNKFGTSAGSGVTAVIIAATPVGTGNEAFITEFGAAARATTADSIVFIEKSNDSFGANVVEIDRIEMPVGGTLLKTYDSPLIVPEGSEFRARFSQGTPGTIGVTMSGQTSGADILD